jgi:hypothetical protein
MARLAFETVRITVAECVKDLLILAVELARVNRSRCFDSDPPIRECNQSSLTF